MDKKKQDRKQDQKQLSDEELALFCEQLGVMLKAGISPAESISIMLEETRGAGEKQLLTCIAEHLDRYEPLEASLKATGVFPDYFLKMVRIGEETGTVDACLELLEVHYRREAGQKRSLKSAMLYPAVMAGMVVAVIIVLLVKVMPIFQQVYVQLGTELTGVSRVLLKIGNGISSYGASVILIAAAVILILLVLNGTEAGRKATRSLSYRTGVSRKLYEETAARRFAEGMAICMTSGLDSESSMQLVMGLSEDPFFSERLQRAFKRVSEGEDFAAACVAEEIFRGSYARMLQIGRRAGAADRALEKIADLYQESIDARLENRIARLEPTLVIVLSVIVGGILLSVMLPLMGVMSGI